MTKLETKKNTVLPIYNPTFIYSDMFLFLFLDLEDKNSVSKGSSSSTPRGEDEPVIVIGSIEEEDYVIAQANAKIDSNDKFIDLEIS